MPMYYPDLFFVARNQIYDAILKQLFFATRDPSLANCVFIIAIPRLSVKLKKIGSYKFAIQDTAYYKYPFQPQLIYLPLLLWQLYG